MLRNYTARAYIKEQIEYCIFRRWIYKSYEEHLHLLIEFFVIYIRTFIIFFKTSIQASTIICQKVRERVFLLRNCPVALRIVVRVSTRIAILLIALAIYNCRLR